MKSIILFAVIFGCIFAQPSFAIFEHQDMQGTPHYRARTKYISVEEAKKITNDGQVTTPLGTYKLQVGFYGELPQADDLPPVSQMTADGVQITEILSGDAPKVNITYFTPEILPSGEQVVKPHIIGFQRD